MLVPKCWSQEQYLGTGTNAIQIFIMKFSIIVVYMSYCTAESVVHGEVGEALLVSVNFSALSDGCV